ncbi:MAG: Wzz/FepE/Etk N-terminal domain-containing protein, partial [Hymenobacteraceae bacterium]|nr:Wzz/FepE/Etk N-terminal domain-containing protein [Hymenobacteraceae bacterium]
MMTKESMELEELNNKHINGVELEEEESSLSDIDFATLFLVAKKSIIWVLLLLIVGGAGAYFYLRYTKPVYKSSSAIKLEVQSEAGALGLAKLGDEGRQNLIKLSGEIELIKSNLIFEKLKDALNLHVNYFAEGNVLDQELYKNSPFNVVYEVKNKGLYDTPVSVKILDENKYRLSYQKGNETVQGEYRFNEVVTNADVILQLRLNDGYSSDLTERNFYFVINSDGALKRYLNENLFVDIINLDASTLGISFTDHTPLKAKDIVNKLDTVYLEQKLEQNNLAKEQTIAFLNRQLLETRDSLQKAEVEMEYFAQRNKTFDVKGDINRLLTSIEELNKESTELGQKIALLNELQRLVDTDSDVEQILPTLGMIEDQQLAEQIKLVSEKQLLRNQALKGSRSNTGAVASIESDIRFIKKNIRELIVRNKQLLQKQVANVNSRTSGIEAELLKIPSKGTEYDRLKRFFDLYEKYYLTLMDKKVEFGIAKAGTTPDFQILSHAS